MIYKSIILAAFTLSIVFSVTADTEVTGEVILAELRPSLDDGLYELESSDDGDDMVVRKKPGRTKYADITLKKGYRCGPLDCDSDGDGLGDGTPEFKEVARADKAELVEAIASKSGLSKADSKKALDSVVDSPAKLVVTGDEYGFIALNSAKAFEKRQEVRRGIGGGDCEDSRTCPRPGSKALSVVTETPNGDQVTRNLKCKLARDNGAVEEIEIPYQKTERSR